MAALIVRPGFTDRLGAGTERGHRNDHRDDEIDLSPGTSGESGAEPDRIVQKPDGTGDRGRLLQEIRELKIDVRLIALQPLGQLHQDIPDVAHVQDGAVGVECLHEAAHVGSLEVMGQIDRQLHRGHGSLLGVVLVADPDRVAEILHADAINRNLPVIGEVLCVGKG